MKKIYVVIWEKCDVEFLDKAFYTEEDAEKYIDEELMLYRDEDDFFYIKEIELADGGNNESFIKFISSNWNNFINKIESENYGFILNRLTKESPYIDLEFCMELMIVLWVIYQANIKITVKSKLLRKVGEIHDV